jgi:hypothetical protein
MNNQGGGIMNAIRGPAAEIASAAFNEECSF